MESVFSIKREHTRQNYRTLHFKEGADTSPIEQRTGLIAEGSFPVPHPCFAIIDYPISVAGWPLPERTLPVSLALSSQ